MRPIGRRQTSREDRLARPLQGEGELEQDPLLIALLKKAGLVPNRRSMVSNVHNERFANLCGDGEPVEMKISKEAAK